MGLCSLWPQVTSDCTAAILKLSMHSGHARMLASCSFSPPKPGTARLDVSWQTLHEVDSSHNIMLCTSKICRSSEQNIQASLVSSVSVHGVDRHQEQT